MRECALLNRVFAATRIRWLPFGQWRGHPYVNPKLSIIVWTLTANWKFPPGGIAECTNEVPKLAGSYRALPEYGWVVGRPKIMAEAS